MSFDWDAWRDSYDTTSFQEQAEFYDRVARDYPEQAHWDLAAARRAMAGVETVTEVGGWRGELADICLKEHPGLRLWVNYDLCRWALTEGRRCKNRRYRARLLKDWPWNTDLPPADLFVSTHTLEHMRWDQVCALARQFRKYRRLHLEVPIHATDGESWRGFTGTHILEASWSDLEALIVTTGFERVAVNSTGFARIYERRA